MYGRHGLGPLRIANQMVFGKENAGKYDDVSNLNLQKQKLNSSPLVAFLERRGFALVVSDSTAALTVSAVVFMIKNRARGLCDHTEAVGALKCTICDQLWHVSSFHC